MTAIAVRDGIMAADTVAWCADGRVKIPCKPKIARLFGGGLVACTGTETDICRALDWIMGRVPTLPALDRQDQFGCLWLKPDGSKWFLGWALYPTERPEPFACIGAPQEFMMGAMYAGASAEEAVRLAVLHTDGAGGDVQVERL